ncbi:AIG2-like protein [Metarhizium album ARSEF 1941]|uniref:Putative gamma-glutamylcyclotransferase n=1 Tax=Metarhizium album (strain ARSEF 1941) TaxID=1081103 RepID=A0A0B2WLW8_METAS|nr:AIG2-like protein [Metarhizium album ARSEF 1941]KHN94482.1 AIG2-like protein [Metarhizium album ARSEF 1941]
MSQERDKMAQETCTQPKPLFVYGTLCAKELLAWALTGDSSNVDYIDTLIRPARVYGFARYRLRGRDYPAATVRGDSYIDGYLVSFQSTSQRRKLDDFEGETYTPVSTRTCILDENNECSGEEIPADIYLWNGPAESLTQEPWELQVFVNESLEDWLDLFQGMELTGGE